MKICSIKGCNKEYAAKGYCKSHYSRFTRYGDPLAPPKRTSSKRKPNIQYEENHLIIDGIENKKCSICEKWFPMNEEYYYKNKKNNTDGFNPYCKRCTIKKSTTRINANPEKVKEYRKAYRQTEKQQTYIIPFKKKQRESGYPKEYYEKNKDYFSNYNRERMANKTHDISNEEWLRCKEYFGNSCAYCGTHENEHYIIYAGKPKKTDLHKEHVDHEGSNKIDNCIPACQTCNSKKWKFSLEDWYNEKNESFTKEKYNKIIKWLNEDYKTYIHNTN